MSGHYLTDLHSVRSSDALASVCHGIVICRRVSRRVRRHWSQPTGCHDSRRYSEPDFSDPAGNPDSHDFQLRPESLRGQAHAGTARNRNAAATGRKLHIRESHVYLERVVLVCIDVPGCRDCGYRVLGRRMASQALPSVISDILLLCATSCGRNTSLANTWRRPEPGADRRCSSRLRWCLGFQR